MGGYHIRRSVYGAGKDSFGLRKSNCPDWFAGNLDLLTLITERKRKALVALKTNPDASHRGVFNKACRDTTRLTRLCIKHYYQRLCDEIETASAFGNIGRMYDGIKSVMGPPCKKTAPLKSKDGIPITLKSEQLDR